MWYYWGMYLHLMPVANVISGFVLGAPALKRIAGLHDHVHKLHTKVEPYTYIIGGGELALGVATLLDRLRIIYFPSLGSSFPQAIIAILIGLLLLYPKLEAYPALAEFVKRFKPYEEAIGVTGIVIGLYRIL